MSLFDEDVRTILAPDCLTWFGDEATYIPESRTRASYLLGSGAIWERPRAERDQEAPVELDAKRWDIIVLLEEDLQYAVNRGDRVRRVIEDVVKLYRLTSDQITPHVEDDDSGLVFVRLHAVEVENG